MTDIKDDWKKWFVALNYISGERVVRTSESKDAYNSLLNGYIKVYAIKGKHELNKELKDEIDNIFNNVSQELKKCYHGIYCTRTLYYTMVYQVLLGNAFYIKDEGKPKKIRLTEYCKMFKCSREQFYRPPYNTKNYYDDSNGINLLLYETFKKIEKNILIKDTELMG